MYAYVLLHLQTICAYVPVYIDIQYLWPFNQVLNVATSNGHAGV